MVLIIQVPAKHSYSVIRGKSLRLRILRKNCDYSDVPNAFIALITTNRTLHLFPLMGINI